MYQQTHPNDQRVLGVPWNVNDDQLMFSLAGIAETAVRLEPTKRSVISLISQIYDPLGLISPVTVGFKILMQTLCKLQLGWDQPLEEDLVWWWNSLVNDLKQSQPIVLPWCYLSLSTNDTTEYRLCGFCDTSHTAYVAVVYLVVDTDGEQSSSFVVSKTRVTPFTTLTMSRLELLSSVLLVRLMTSVAESLSPRIKFKEPRCFTDSRVVFYWIRGAGREWKPFVQNRVDEIRRLLPVDCWSHCPGKENPADIPSRGLTPSEFRVNRMCKDCPPWLKTSIDVTMP